MGYLPALPAEEAFWGPPFSFLFFLFSSSSSLSSDSPLPSSSSSSSSSSLLELELPELLLLPLSSLTDSGSAGSTTQPCCCVHPRLHHSSLCPTTSLCCVPCPHSCPWCLTVSPHLPPHPCFPLPDPSTSPIPTTMGCPHHGVPCLVPHRGGTTRSSPLSADSVGPDSPSESE